MNPLMIPRLALKALSQNKLRTGLTMLGIIIGVGAVIRVIAIGEGASASVERAITFMRAWRPGTAFIDVFQNSNANTFTRVAHIATATGARTSVFVPDLNRLFLAVPHRGSQRAEIRVYGVH